MKRFSIKLQILIISMIPVLLIDVFLTSLNINNSLEQARQRLQAKGEISGKQIASAIEFYLFSGNNRQIQHLLDQVVNKDDIVYASVYNRQGERLAESSTTRYSVKTSDSYFYYREPIKTQLLEGEDVFEPRHKRAAESADTLGWVHIYISQKILAEKRQQIMAEGLIFFAALLVVSFLLAAYISQRITRPVYVLLDHLRRIEHGELGTTISNISDNEIGDVQRGFNSMSQSLLANQQELNEKIEQATEELRQAITDLEDNNRELGLARDAAQEANRVKSQFLANISHEIRTPINGVKGFVNLLKQTGLKRNQKRYLDIIQQSTSDLSSIINELLDFSKLESGKVKIIDSEFDLFNLLETTRDSLFSTSMDKQIDLNLTVFSDTPQMLIGDPFRLKQILINLIGNAIKFTDKGYVSITVYLLDGDDTQSTILFRIEDSGIGISEDQQKKLFLAFSQLESDANRRYSGTGLGLVISRNLARLMGGDITLESSPGVGSIFTLELPFKLVQQDESNAEQDDAKTAFVFAANRRCLAEIQSVLNRVGVVTETQLIESPASIEIYREQIRQNIDYLDYIVFDLRHMMLSPGDILQDLSAQLPRVIIMHYDMSLVAPAILNKYEFISVINTGTNISQILAKQEIEDVTQETTILKPLKSARILVVDDNRINLTLAAELANLWGHSADMAQNANEAMEYFRAHNYDLILLDLQMPEIDGIELMKMMRKEKPRLDCPIVSLTANAIEEEEKIQLMNEGFSACLSKPLDEQKLNHLLDPKAILAETSIQPATPIISNEQDDRSVDFELSLKLCANNQKLSRNMLEMLYQSLPEYREQLHNSLARESLGKLAYITHKLHGVTCYTGLPRLKRQLNRYEGLKHGDPEIAFKAVREILDELDKVQVLLEEHLESAEPSADSAP